jgi:hypothetical protein
MLDRPADDADAEREDVVGIDLLRPLAADERRDELALRLAGLVDVHRLVRDDLVQRVRDSRDAGEESNARLAVAGGKAGGIVHV